LHVDTVYFDLLTRLPRGVDNVNMVKTGYHHGNLREALVQAGFELAREGGPAAVQLRAVTREAGVSHNAAYRHFANQEDLLAAVAERCMDQLGSLMIERMDAISARGPVRRAEARLNAIGRAYIEFARTEPGWFRTAFTSAEAHETELPEPKPSEMDAGTNPFFILSARLDELVAVGALTPQRRAGAEFAAWAGVHGLSSLLLDGPLRLLPDDQVGPAIDIVLDNIARGLR
jgi:AcrR family transcriptional regulator